MGKLSTENLKFIAGHIERIKKGSGTWIYFCFDSKYNGGLAYNILTSSLDYWDTYSGLDRRDFRMSFVDKDTRDKVYDELQSAIAKYQAAHIVEVQQTYGTQGLDAPSTTGDDELKTKSTSWTTYLIIGAAAVAVILLLWDRKKK